MTTSQSARGFYDLDNILCEEERIPTEFLNDAVGLGILNTSSGSNDLKAGSKTELPYWLASMLCKMQFVRIDVPKVYTPKYTAKLIAGPETVAMSDWSPWYFLLARRYAEMSISGFNIGDELTQKVENLIPVLKETLLTRFRKIILTDHSRQGDMSLLMRKLSDVERRLVVKKELAVTDYEDWRKSSYTAGHVSGAQKRRR